MKQKRSHGRDDEWLSKIKGEPKVLVVLRKIARSPL
jgi:hypothetical protein